MTAHTACNCTSEQPQIDLSLLEPILQEHAGDDGALIAVLQGAQHLYGYLPPEALREIALQRQLPLSQVYGVATFYSQFHLEPRGRSVVRICHGTACHVAGAPEVTRALEDELGVEVGATADNLSVTVEAVACVGCCGLAPVVVVDDQVHGKVDAAAARKLGRTIRRQTRS